MEIQILSEEIPRHGSGVERSEGLHLTDIISDLGVELGYFKRESEEKPWIMFEMGFNWEVALAQAWAGRNPTWRPEEVNLNGISGSPDGLCVDDKGLFVEEYKCTWSSANKSMDERWYWLTQGMAYCYMVGTDRCIWEVLYVCGDYSRPIKPLYRRTEVTFTQRELRENWQMIIRHAEYKGLLKCKQ